MGQKTKATIWQKIANKFFAGTFLDRRFVKGKRQLELAFYQAINNIEEVYNVRSCFIPKIEISSKEWSFGLLPRGTSHMRFSVQGTEKGEEVIATIRRITNGCDFMVENFQSRMITFLKLCIQAQVRYKEMRKRGCAYKFKSLYYKP